MRRYDEAIAQHRKALDLDPNAAWIRHDIAYAYTLKGAYAQAIAEDDKIPEQAKVVAAENKLIASGIGWIYAVSGRRADALKIAEQFKDLASHAYVDFYQVAEIYAGLGDKDEAFRLLEKAYEEHSSNMPFLAVDPLSRITGIPNCFSPERALMRASPRECALWRLTRCHRK